MEPRQARTTADLPTRTITYRTDSNPRKFMLSEGMAYRASLGGAGFGVGFCFMVIVSFWREYVFDRAVFTFAFFGGALAFFCVYLVTGLIVLRLNYQQYELETIEEHTPPPPVDPVRITYNGRTAVIYEPTPGAFARWARAALEDNVYFSNNQVLTGYGKGFSLDNVVGELRRLGILHDRPNGDKVHTLTDAGRAALKEWLSG